jgi:hypothetical protein
MTPFVKPAVSACVVAAGAVGLSVSSSTHDAASATRCTPRDARPDATSGAQARQMRLALMGAGGRG